MPVPQPTRGAARAPVAIEPAAGPDGGVTIRFIAPLAAVDGRSGYSATIEGAHGTSAEVSLTTDVAVGAPVERRLPLPAGRYRIDVRYRVRAPFPRTNGGLSSPGHPVGHAVVRVPPKR
jgi:hypothetical protein